MKFKTRTVSGKQMEAISSCADHTERECSLTSLASVNSSLLNLMSSSILTPRGLVPAKGLVTTKPF